VRTPVRAIPPASASGAADGEVCLGGSPALGPSATAVSTAASLSEARVDAIRKNFQQWDRDGDGYIDTSEAAHVLSLSGLSASALDAGAARLIGTMDTDGDGRVSWEEFERRYLAKSTRSHAAGAETGVNFMSHTHAHRPRRSDADTSASQDVSIGAARGAPQ